MHPTADTTAPIYLQWLGAAGDAWRYAAAMKGMRIVLQVTLFTLSLTRVAFAQEKHLPRFEDYPAEVFRGTPAPAKIVGPLARSYRTRLRDGAKEGPNFAGHYTVVYWGCGSDCRMFAVVNAKTGKVYFPPGIRAVSRVPSQEEDPIQYRGNSRLLVIAGEVWPGGGQWSPEATYYYEWRGAGLKLVRRVALKKYGRWPIPPQNNGMHPTRISGPLMQDSSLNTLCAGGRRRAVNAYLKINEVCLKK